MRDGDLIAVGKDFTVHRPAPKHDDALVAIKSPLGWSVKIRYDGKIEYSDGYDPDEAALLLWQAIAGRFAGGVQAALVDPDSN